MHVTPLEYILIIPLDELYKRGCLVYFNSVFEKKTIFFLMEHSPRFAAPGVKTIYKRGQQVRELPGNESASRA